MQRVRLKNIHLTNQLKRIEATLRAKEELAEGLHLIDFEQLKIENQSLNEKIEERNEELLKLRKKTTTTVQVGACVGLLCNPSASCWVHDHVAEFFTAAPANGSVTSYARMCTKGMAAFPNANHQQVPALHNASSWTSINQSIFQASRCVCLHLSTTYNASS